MPRGHLVLTPSDRDTAEMKRWVGRKPGCAEGPDNCPRALEVAAGAVPITQEERDLAHAHQREGVVCQIAGPIREMSRPLLEVQAALEIAGIPVDHRDIAEQDGQHL